MSLPPKEQLALLTLFQRVTSDAFVWQGIVIVANPQIAKDYKNWLMLSNGLEFADKIVYKLEELDLENPVTGPEDGKEYIAIASLSGTSDCLVFDPATKEVIELTDDGKMRTGDFVYHVIQEGFEYLEDE